MKHKVFALNNLTVRNAYAAYLDGFNMYVLKGQTLGIICSDINEKMALLQIFEGEYPIPESNFYFDRTEKKKLPSVRMFKKHFSVIGIADKVLPEFTVIDNLLLTPDHPDFLLNKDNTRKMAESLLQEFSPDIPLDLSAADLTTAQKYNVELIRAFVQKKKIIVLTNMHDRFSIAETDALLDLMEKLMKRGMTFILMLDTPDKMLTDMTEMLLIIKNGRNIAQIETDIFHFSELYNYMITGSIDPPAIHTLPGGYGYNDSLGEEDDDDPVISMNHVRTLMLSDLDFSLYPGELLKIICIDQNSIDAFKNLIAGADSILTGNVTFRNQKIRFQKLSDTIRNGIFWCPRSPYQNLLFDNLSMIDNLLLGPMTKADKKYVSAGLRENLKAYCTEYFPGTDPERPVRELNNKIRQELAFRKILLQAPKFIVIEKPFDETILGMNEITHRMIEELQHRGTCVVVISMSLSDEQVLEGNTLYMQKGKVIDEVEMYAQLY